MDNDFFIISSQKNPRITVRVVAGHFATSSAHRSHYIDIFDLISGASAARDAARQLAVPYRASTLVDAIVYMDKTEILAAFLADELLQAGMSVMNEGREILLLTPMPSSDGHFIFHRNVQDRIKNKNVVLMVASLSTGDTVSRMQECLAYYGCKLAGISAVFSVFPEYDGREIHSLFDCADIPDYHFYKPSECKMCREGKKIDAIISSEGYTKF
ncbi:MAG: phosphoribosyltransferase [Treponema sp.]|jgi:orotate phosphoribosyltransferase|nr:phosphoribosyltransferase [Treponema sp.]